MDPKAKRYKTIDINPRLEKFKRWIEERGGEILKGSNSDEILRFRSSRGVSVIYHNNKGILSFFGEAETAWEAYLHAHQWRANNVPRQYKTSDQDLDTLYERDKGLCFFCQCHVQHVDASAEHLVAKTHGGPNHIANKFLAHKLCNSQAGHLSAVEKIAIHTRAVLDRAWNQLMNKLEQS